MYRSAVKRMIVAASRVRNGRAQLCHDRAIATNLCRFYASATSETLSNQSPNHHQRHPHAPLGALNHPDPASSASDSSDGGGRRESQTSKGTRPRAEYQDEQARVLGASLRHVISLGWTEAAMIAGAREVCVSPSIVGSFSRKEAALVEFFMDECLQRLIDIIDSSEDFGNMLPSERITKLIKIRLELQAPYISKWPQALSIQAQPLNISTSFKQRAMLVDEIWHAAGDEATDVDWYAKRAALGAIYSATEVYMLTDSSTDFRDTWAFLDARVKDAFDLKKTLQEAKYFAEAVGAGMESSVQGFMRRVFRAEN